MSRPGSDYVRRQLEGRFYAEALYFGALELGHAPSAELHLYLGLACCGSCGGVADVQRSMHGDPAAPIGASRPMAGTGSQLVYEGLYHLLEAARQGLRVPHALAPVGVAIVDDLRWYLREDFKSYVSSGSKLTLREAASGATALLRRLLPNPPPVPEDLAFELRRGEEIVDQELSASGGDAAFYHVKDVPPTG